MERLAIASSCKCKGRARFQDRHSDKRVGDANIGSPTHDLSPVSSPLLPSKSKKIVPLLGSAPPFRRLACMFVTSFRYLHGNGTGLALVSKQRVCGEVHLAVANSAFPHIAASFAGSHRASYVQ